jgi:alkylation response protein AidB-like acyl-CoA dehydrogenase
MSDYLLELRDSARQVIDGAGTAADEDASWRQIVDLGWLLAAVPESAGGLGLGIDGACALQTELGRGLSRAPFLPAVMALDALCHGDAAAPAILLETFSVGDLATAPLAEPQIDLERADGPEPVLTGRVAAVQCADRASRVLLWSADERCVALVAMEHSGVQVTARPTWDATRRLFDLQLDGVALAGHSVLARDDSAAALIARIRTLRDLLLAADALGSAAALLEMTVEHLQTRQQFGRPLALFQALKHRCADLKTQLAAAQSLHLGCLAQVGDALADPEAALRGQKAKYLSCSAFSTIAEEALQLHGGIGMAAEHSCHLFLKRAMLSEHLGSRETGYERAIADRFLDALQ